MRRSRIEVRCSRPWRRISCTSWTTSKPWRPPSRGASSPSTTAFVHSIALPLRFDHDDFGVLAIYAERPHVFNADTVAVLSGLADDISYGVNALRDRAGRDAYRVRFEASLEAAVKAIATAAELRDPYTAGHQRHVAELASAIAARLGIDAELAVGIGVAASIHDIGKLVVPAEILSKPGRLSDAEYALVQGHAQAGHDIMAGIDFDWPVAEMILDHHERLDGSGYPRGLRGDEISIAARILAVADTDRGHVLPPPLPRRSGDRRGPRRTRQRARHPIRR